jgi:hypothetical protein
VNDIAKRLRKAIVYVTPPERSLYRNYPGLFNLIRIKDALREAGVDFDRLLKTCGRLDGANGERNYLVKVAIAKAEELESLIRVPAKFYDDHDERGCEPFCDPVKRSSRFVWLSPSDPGLAELLDDARHYADEFGPDELGGDGSLKRSATATVRAIETAVS